MKRAKISELKNELSRYLRYVRRGESVLILDRDRPVARIDPVRSPASLESADWTAELERAGVLRGPVAALPSDWLARRAPAKPDVVAALLEERETGR
jgi:prevent-host-death family protein